MKLPTARVILGPKVKLYLTTLAILIRCSFEQVRTLLRIQYRFAISDGEIAAILYQESLKLRPEYEAIVDRVRHQAGNHDDETSWPVREAGEGITPSRLEAQNLLWFTDETRCRDDRHSCFSTALAVVEQTAGFLRSLHGFARGVRGYYRTTVSTDIPTTPKLHWLTDRK